LLINKFVLKLADSNIRQWTHRANPATYNAAMTAESNEAASQSSWLMRLEQEGKATLQSMHLGAAAVPVTDAAVSTTTLLLVLTPVPTVMATKTNLEVKVSHEGAEAVAETQDEVEEDSNERTYRREEEEQEGLLPEGDSATTTTGTAASMASGEKRNSMTSTATNYRVTTTHPASTTSTGNSTRQTIEAAGAGTSADGDVRNIHSITLGGRHRCSELLQVYQLPPQTPERSRTIR
jgi:hypothetical protein